MSLVIVLLAFACLIGAAYLWSVNRKQGIDGLGKGRIRIWLIVLVLAGVLLALASQLSIFRG